MKTCRFFLVLLVLTVCTMGECNAPSMQDIHSDYWVGMYKGSKKYGHGHTTVSVAKFEGKPSYRMLETVTAPIPSTSGAQIVNTHAVYYNTGFRPVYEYYSSARPGSQFSVKARYMPSAIECTVVDNGKATRKRIQIPKTPDVFASSVYGLGVRKLRVGDTYRSTDFKAYAQKFETSEVQVRRKESLQIGAAVYETFVLHVKCPTYELDLWTMDNGELVRADNLTAKLSIRRMPKQEAVSGISPGD
jgi:hypothetical protein